MARVSDDGVLSEGVLDRRGKSARGTTAILAELGWSMPDVNGAFDFYRKRVVKIASRLAYTDPTRGRELLPYFLEAVDLFGEQDTRALIAKGADVIRLLTQYDIHNVDGFRILTPTSAGITLEAIVGDKLKGTYLTPVYIGERTSIYDYPKRM